VGKTLGQFDQSLAQIVERLAQATGEIRDAVEALPAALRQTTHFR
jgi:ABC-type transporter Mla subunit MlaD